jgi:hypothetical protein
MKCIRVACYTARMKEVNVQERFTAGVVIGPGSTEGGSACQIGISGAWCGRPAESTWEAGCVHEHVFAVLGVCSGHRHLTARQYYCNRCDHECPVLLRERTEHGKEASG